VDNHASILLQLKKEHGIRKENSCDLEATVGLNIGHRVVHRTASGQEILQLGVLTELPPLSYFRTPQNFITFYTFLLPTRSYSTE
jgi:hypothetical protein